MSLSKFGFIVKLLDLNCINQYKSYFYTDLLLFYDFIIYIIDINRFLFEVTFIMLFYGNYDLFINAVYLDLINKFNKF